MHSWLNYFYPSRTETVSADNFYAVQINSEELQNINKIVNSHVIRFFCFRNMCYLSSPN